MIFHKIELKKDIKYKKLSRDKKTKVKKDDDCLKLRKDYSI